MSESYTSRCLGRVSSLCASATHSWCEVGCPDLLCCTVQKLKGQVTGLKASRDKLLAEVDRQSTEIERLLTHNATLEQVGLTSPACFTCLLCLCCPTVM